MNTPWGILRYSDTAEEVEMSDIREIAGTDFHSEVLGSEVPVVVDFWAPWCGPCRMVALEMERLSKDVGGRAKVVKVNVDDNRELAMEYGVMSIPTIAKFEGGQVVGQIVGARDAATIASTFGLA
jgi:thioredoxin 1